MADHTRNEYLKALNQMRANYQNNGNVLINTQDDSTQVGEELSSFAYMNTTAPAPTIEQSSITQATKTDRNGWERTVDTFTDTRNNVISGVLNFLDGLGDLAVYVGGAVGSIFDPNYRDWVQSWQNYDWQSHVLGFINQVDVFDDALTGDLFDGTYGQKWANVWNTEAARADINATKQSAWTSDLGKFGEIVTSVEEGIGYVLPSVAVGIISGGSTIAGQGFLGIMGASAAGSGTTQALNEGATYGQAALSGAITGGIEVATEAISAGIGKAVGKVTGKATNFGKRIGGGVFGDTIEKLSIRSLLQAGLEEGMEEVAGALFEPLAKEVYDKGAFARAWTPGTKENKEMLNDALISGLSGAAGGVFGGTVTGVYYKNKLGNNGIEAVNLANQIRQESQDSIKHFQKQGENANFEQIDKVDAEIKAKAEQFQEKMLELKEKEPKHFENVMKLLSANQAFINKTNREIRKGTLTSEQVETAFLENYKQIEKDLGKDTYTRIAELNSTPDIHIKIGTAEQFQQLKEKKGGTNEAFIKNGKEVVINPAFKKQIYSLLGHEAISHAILDTDKTTRTNLIKYIKNNSELNKIYTKVSDAELSETYETNNPETLESERLANFIENYIKNQKTYNKALGISQKRGLLRLLEKVGNSLSRTEDNQFLKQINKAVNEIREEVKTERAKTQESLAYSKELSDQVDSEGNKLSNGQVEFFKNSKVRDENGNLMVVYHGTNEDFTVFDRTRARANMDIQGNFFSPYRIEAEGYGSKVGVYYLNITNPASEKQGYAALNKYKGQNNAGVKARDYLISQGYDGVIGYDEYIVFESNQIKSVDNLNPTENEDIRFAKELGKGSELDQRADESDKDYRKRLLSEIRKESPKFKDNKDLDNKGLKTLLKQLQKPKEYNPEKPLIKSKTQIKPKVSQEIVDKTPKQEVKLEYENNNGTEDDFRRIQEESRKESFESVQKQSLYIASNERLRKRLSPILKRWVDSRRTDSSTFELLHLKNFDVYSNVDGKTFHDAFELVRKYTINGELVDLHDIKTTDDDVGYNDTYNYLSEDGLSGFAITKDGDLISVFNGSRKRDFLRAIADIVKRRAKTLDCYVSPNQDLQQMYSKIFEFKTASVMEHNIKYDHDNIAKNHNNPKVAFMVNTKQDVETKTFAKDDYAAAKAYQLEVLKAPPSTPSATTNTKDITYKSIETTRDIVSVIKNNTERVLGRGKIISLPNNFDNFSEKSFTQINTYKQLEKEARKVTDLFLDASIEQLNEDTNQYESLGKVKDTLTKQEQKDLYEVVKEVIKTSDDTVAKSKATLKLEKLVDKLNFKVKDYGNRVGRVRVLTNQLNYAKNQVKVFDTLVDDEVARNGLRTLLKPFKNLRGTDKSFKSKGFKENINDVLGWYNEENIAKNYPGLPYSPALRQELEDLYDSIGDPAEHNVYSNTVNPETGKRDVVGTKKVYGSLTTEAVNHAIKAIRMIRAEIRMTNENLLKKTIPNAHQTYKIIKAMKYGQKSNVLAKLFRWYKRGFAPAYVMLRQMLGGNSAIADLLTTQMNNARNSKILYTGNYALLIDEEMKRLKVKRTFDKSTITVHGIKYTIDQAMFLYNALKIQENFDAINENGIQMWDENDKLTDVLEKGNAEQLKADLEELLPQQYKDFADYLLELLNGNIKEDYIEWYESRYGKFEGRNEIGKVGENNYWMLFRSYQVVSNLEKAMSSMGATFARAKSRKGGSNAVLIGGALGSVNTYIDQLAKEIYLKPLYREYVGTMNTKVDGKTLQNTLAQKIGKQDIAYINKTIESILEISDKPQNSLITGIMGRFAVAKLSLNIGSTLKQFASIYTSNIPLRQSTKAFLAKVFRSSELRTEYLQLVDEIGGLKFRERGSAVVKGNVDTLTGTSERIANIGMKPISKMDLFTVGVGVYSLMIIGQDQYGYKIGTEENKNFVKENWSDFELSQIGSGALSQSAVSRGDFGSIPKAIFSFMQGANRAAFGSQINKVDLFLRNHKLKKADVIREYNEAKAELERMKGFIEDIGENEADAIQTSAYLEAQERFKDAELKKQDYERYEVAGAKMIPVNMAAGLMAQGIFIALINELVRHVKGKKDWDEWDIAELGSNSLMAMAVEWIPLVNTLANLFKGYDVTIPSVSLMNQMGDIYQSLSQGNYRSGIRQIAILLGDSTGIPVETIYQYIYGTVKIFDPEIAWEMKSVLYGTSLQSASKTLKTYADKGNLNKSVNMVNVIMENYKTGSVSEPLAKELASLYIDGYNAIPKSYMTEYTNDDGETVSLTKEQINAFKTEYANSNKAAQQLMYITDYRSSTQEDRAKMMKRLYDAYYEYAKAKTVGKSASSKLARVLQLTNGKIRLAKYIPALLKIASITETKNKTRKELVLSYINKLTGLTKQEKIMLMYLAGYKVSGTSQKGLISYMTSLGAKRKEVLELLS